jgi:glycosyltransferase involved in cell wall biosynthesis
MTRVSVVMPVYNAASTVARALESVLAQSRPADEIIVVDDGSTDGSGDVVRGSGGSRVTLVRQENLGASSARNTGIARATGDVVALLDADDSWDETKLARQCPVFERHPEVVATASNWRRHDGGRVLTGIPLPAHHLGRAVRATGDDLLRFAFSMTSSTVAVRREAFTRHRFDEGLVTAEDRDMWIRLVADGPVWFDEAVLTTIVFRNDSLSSSDVDRDCACMIEVLGRYAGVASRRETRRWEARTYARWAGVHLAAGRAGQALPLAHERWRREWRSPQAWWVLAKCWWRAPRQS